MFSIEDLRDAWTRVKKISRQDFIPLPIHYAIYERNLEENLADLNKRLGEQYSFDPVRLIDVPKLHYALRPGALLQINDHIVYETCVNHIYTSTVSHLIREQVPDVVFGHSTMRDKGTSKHKGTWQREHARWVAKNIATFEAGYTFLVSSDIAGYYEIISHRLLFNQLSAYGADPAVLELLRQGLRRWTNGGDVSIPQGPDASNVLAELYLDDVDKFMVRRGYAYSRWVDDLRIFAKSRREAKAILKDLIQQLRRLGLVVQTAKTRILEEERIREFLNPIQHRKDILQDRLEDEIIDRIAREVEYLPFYDPFDPEAKEWLRKEYTEEFELPPLRALFDVGVSEHTETHVRYLKYAITELMRRRDRHALGHEVRLLTDYPFVADRLVGYLIAVDEADESIPALLDYLQSENNIYDWGEMWLMYHFAHLWRPPNNELSAALYKIIQDRNRHFASRYNAILALGNHADLTTLRGLRADYDSETDPLIKEAIIISLRRLPRAERNAFIAACAGETRELDQASRFVRQASVEEIDRLLGRTA